MDLNKSKAPFRGSLATRSEPRTHGSDPEVLGSARRRRRVGFGPSGSGPGGARQNRPRSSSSRSVHPGWISTRPLTPAFRHRNSRRSRELAEKLAGFPVLEPVDVDLPNPAIAAAPGPGPITAYRAAPGGLIFGWHTAMRAHLSAA